MIDDDFEVNISQLQLTEFLKDQLAALQAELEELKDQLRATGPVNAKLEADREKFRTRCELLEKDLEYYKVAWGCCGLEAQGLPHIWDNSKPNASLDDVKKLRTRCEELEKTIADMLEQQDTGFPAYKRRIEELEKENADLKERVPLNIAFGCNMDTADSLVAEYYRGINEGRSEAFAECVERIEELEKENMILKHQGISSLIGAIKAKGGI